MNSYSVRYRRNNLTGRTYRVTVHAANADEARAKAALRDPEYLSSVEVKNRGPVGTFKVDAPDPLTEAKRRDWLAQS